MSISNVNSAGTQGLTYYTYACPTWPCTQVGTALSTGIISTTINYNWGGGQVLDSGRSDYVSVKVTGYINIPGTTGQQKLVYFMTSADDGTQLKVNNQMILNDWSGLHAEQGYSTGLYMMPGVYPFEAWFSEWGGGAIFRLYWSVDGGPGNAQYHVLIDPQYLATDSTFWSGAVGGGGSYTSNITNSQQTNINANLGRTTALANGNEIYIDQVGNNNTTTITQTGNYNKITGTTQQTATISGNSNSTTIRQNSGTGKNLIDLNVTGTGSNTLNLNQGYLTDGTLSGNQLGNNYQKVDVQGNNNSLTTQQNRDVGTVGNYMEHTVIGNYNSITSTQSGDNKLLFNSITGNNNTVSTTQSGTGAQHYIDLTLTGAGNTATVNQSGNTQNKATIVINNLGGPAGINLTQTGGQTYNITTNCVTLGGCGTTTVTQGN